MENQDIKEKLIVASERIRQALSRGPLGRQKGFIGTQDKASPEVPAEPAATAPVKPFDRVRQAMERIREMGSHPLVSVVSSSPEEVLSVDEPAAEDLSSADVPDQTVQNDLETLRRAQKANVERSTPVKVAPSAPVTVPVSSVASQGPSLPDLLNRMGRREFSRVVQDTLAFDRARYGLAPGYDFLAAEARSERSEPASPSSIADQTALRGFIRKGIADRGIEKTEETLRTILYLEDVRARQEAAKSVKTTLDRVSESAGPAPMTALEVQSLAAKHLRATMAADWTPDQESSENVARVERELARSEDRAVREKINDIGSMERKIMGMEGENPALILGSGSQRKEEEWAPRAHELLAAHERDRGRPVDEAALDSARKESGIYRLWRAFVRATGGKKEEPAEPASVLREVEPASTPSVPSGKIREVRGGVYELKQG